MSTSDPHDQTDPIKDAIFAGQKITAIELYREQTKLGLAEAKEAVEKMEAELRLSSPERFTNQSPRKGCLVIMVGVVLGATLWKVLA